MRNFLQRMANKMRTFLYGRNGFDNLAKHSMIASIVVFLIYGFWTPGVVKFALAVLTYMLMGYAYFRIFSKNVYKRVQENKKYLGFINMTKTRWQQRKTHRFFRCPKCKTWLRVPKGRGKITITCVKCSTKFDKRT
jgi:hypothetical protein